MAKFSAILKDASDLKPVIEALIFASEEPLPPRLLVRILLGESDAKPKVQPFQGAELAEEFSEDSGGVSEVIDALVAPFVFTAPSEEEVSGGELNEGMTSRENIIEPATDSEEHWLEQEIGVVEKEGDEVAEEMEDRREDVGELAYAYENAEDFSTGRARKELGDIIDQRVVRQAIDELNTEYEESNRAFRIVEVAGGFQYATIREYGEYVALLSKEKGRRRLSPAALETLSIIAYRQPASKPEIEAIRGVNCDQVLLNLLEKNLIAITGRSEGVGRPLLYGTTDEFLRCFGLNALKDLPKLREIEELMEDDAHSAERMEVVTIDSDSNAAEIEAIVGAAGHNDEGGDEVMGDGTENVEVIPETEQKSDAREDLEHEAREAFTSEEMNHEA